MSFWDALQVYSTCQDALGVTRGDDELSEMALTVQEQEALCARVEVSV